MRYLFYILFSLRLFLVRLHGLYIMIMSVFRCTCWLILHAYPRHIHFSLNPAVPSGECIRAYTVQIYPPYRHCFGTFTTAHYPCSSRLSSSPFAWTFSVIVHHRTFLHRFLIECISTFYFFSHICSSTTTCTCHMHVAPLQSSPIPPILNPCCFFLLHIAIAFLPYAPLHSKYTLLTVSPSAFTSEILFRNKKNTK
ncbi:hypothetical protein J3R30DRAFT_46774 [Lentinula aciculospora]|uniref:Uncharacterized protein n=1 Tax=Lentinula aciculospora TaxID=153920 RepID=A0A9W9AVW2_9AGAR|nr:hypothetical protein J3R30DRAFT_46774 [Lentinula aciculospora]